MFLTTRIIPKRLRYADVKPMQVNDMTTFSIEGRKLRETVIKGIEEGRQRKTRGSRKKDENVYVEIWLRACE